MRKIFTLVAAASIACAANAQTVETYSPYNEDGTLKENMVADPDAAKMTVVDISTASVKAELTSGPIAGYDNGQTLPLVAKYGNAIKQGQAPGSKNNPAVKMYPDTTKLLFPYVQGEGNPANLEKIDFEKIMTEGEWTGDYRANWDNAYYVADGSAGLPKNGTYMTFTPAVDGDLDVFVWSNKGNRYTFVVKGSDMKAIPYNSDELTASGWIAATNYTEEDGAEFAGFPKYQEVLPLKAELMIAEGKEADVKPNDYYCFGAGNQIALAHLKLKAKAGETYWVFQHSSQIGLINYSFTATGSTPEPPVVEPGEPTVSITWPMAIEDNGRVLSLTPIVEGFDPANLVLGEPTFGSNLGWKEDEPARNVDGLPFAVVQPKENVGEAPDGQTTLTFTVGTVSGVLFQPTQLNFLACVVGTDKGNYNLTYNCGSVNGTLENGFHPNRNNEANGFYSDCKYDFTLEPSADPFNVVFDIYNLANNKQIGFRNVVIKGKLSGNVGLSTIAVDENAPVEYYNLQGVRIANPEHGLYIKRQGNKVTKVIL